MVGKVIYFPITLLVGPVEGEVGYRGTRLEGKAEELFMLESTR